MSQTTIDPNTIKAAVQEHYGSRIKAAAEGGSCCGPAASSCCEPSTELLLHGPEALASLPEGVVTASYGCGNPLALASLKPGEVVLDLGSGGGLEVLLAAQRVGESGYVYGLDMTDAMLEVARRNAVKVGAQNVAFLKGDIEAIPLPDQSVDVIISNCVINLAPDKGQVLGDAFRVIKPGGRLSVSDIVFDGELSDLPIDEAQLRGALSWAACFAGALTMGDYRRLLEEAGFERIGLEVTRRYSIAELREEGAEILAGLPAEVVQTLEGKVTSCAITAWKPA
jgi:arsenite methyltransferase